MSEDFVPLAEFLHPTPEPRVEGPPAPAAPPARSESAEAVRAARLFRAALADALDAAVEDLLRSIARDVLRRELRLDPADLEAFVIAALERHGREEVLAIRAHPGECAAVAGCGIAPTADERLQRGDVVLELRSGTIDMSLAARLHDALEHLAV